MKIEIFSIIERSKAVLTSGNGSPELVQSIRALTALNYERERVEEAFEVKKEKALRRYNVALSECQSLF